jgi:mono/diheme cytochrome c family protein
MAAAAATKHSAKRSHRSVPLHLIAAGLGLLLAAIPARYASADPDAVARGAYLAAAAGCDGCHTDSKNAGAPYAGGRVMTTPFGAIATPNITPDGATGIGGWSNADFVRAMRWGIAPDGSHYAPIFPFPYFAGLSDGDLADLRAFLNSLNPATQPVAAAASLALAPRAYAAIGTAVAANRGIAAPPRDPVAARGQYLVDTLGHCGHCHTPLTWLGAPDRGRYLAGSRGGLSDGAPNITPDPKTGIGEWTEDDIVALLKDGIEPDGDFVGGAMAEIVRNTTRLTGDDRRAIAVYLKTVPAKVFVKKR